MNKLIEKILDKLEELKLPFPDNCPSYYGDTNTLIDKVKQIVQEEAEEYNDGWIPVISRQMTEEEKELYPELLFEGEGVIYECPLPEDDQEVFITTKEGTVDITTFYTDCGCYFEYYEDEDEVLAWKPLIMPDAYKEGK